ncbi:MAG: Crp/Fnr family transcriptional regulator [Clostridiales bacterium]|jgi:CRP-like cAMP-binding protein|nr:Crp/Fnr family transcriptional regulator [Clostridiales bacterium]
MNYLEILKSAALFKGIDDLQLAHLLKCIGANQKIFKKGEFVLLAGDNPTRIGILLSGQLHILSEDSDGNSFFVGILNPGEIAGGALCCAGVAESPISVMAKEQSEVLLMDFSRILATCSSSCANKQKLLINMLQYVSNRNVQLQNRLGIVSVRSVRKKILRYLLSFGREEIAIPFNRQEMADFLAIERSALSHELGKMKKDGIIDYRKNRFWML